MNDRNAAIISMATIMYTYHQCQCYCCCHTGYVPQDKPGTAGYYTPRSSALYANDCFDHADCTSRNPVMSRLNGELRSNPFRHRTARKLHVRGWYLKVPAHLFHASSALCSPFMPAVAQFPCLPALWCISFFLSHACSFSPCHFPSSHPEHALP